MIGAAHLMQSGGNAASGPSTWSTTTKGTAINVTNANKTASGTVAGGAYAAIIGTKSYAKGSGLVRYCEVAHGAAGGTQVGLADASVTLNSYLGSDAHSCGWIQPNGVYFDNGTNVATLGVGYTDSSVVGLLLNTSLNTIQFSLNGANVGSPQSFTPSVVFPAWLIGISATTAQATLRTAAADLQYLPSGATAWG